MKSKININKVYTRKGDNGKTQLTGGQVVDKDDVRIEAYGTIDELQVIIGGCVNSLNELELNDNDRNELRNILKRIQNELFNVGSSLSRLNEDVNVKTPKLLKENINQLEKEIDQYNKILPSLNSFVLPGGNNSNICFHMARAVCRRSERVCVRLSKKSAIDQNIIPYLNRLSDALFVWSRWILTVTNIDEQLWNPNLGE